MKKYDILITGTLKILISIAKNEKPKNITKISKENNMTWNQTQKNIKKLEKLKLIKTNITGRQRNVELTKKGKEKVNNIILTLTKN